MKKIAIALAVSVILSLWVNAGAVNITMNQRLPLRKHTHVNQDVSPWDTVYVLITDSTNSLVGDTIWLDSDEAGTYYGTWWPTGIGSYVANYHARWTDGSIVIEEEYFSVLDTAAFHGGASGLNAGQIAHAVKDTMRGLVYYWGACDSCYERHFPEDGTFNKDSSYIINPTLTGSDTLVAKVEFRHSNVPSVADTSYFYLNPWW